MRQADLIPLLNIANLSPESRLNSLNSNLFRSV